MGRRIVLSLCVIAVSVAFSCKFAFGLTCDEAVTLIYDKCGLDFDGPQDDSLAMAKAIDFCNSTETYNHIITNCVVNPSYPVVPPTPPPPLNCGEVAKCIDTNMAWTPCNFASDFIYNLCGDNHNKVTDASTKNVLTKTQFRGLCEYAYSAALEASDDDETDDDATDDDAADDDTADDDAADDDESDDDTLSAYDKEGIYIHCIIDCAFEDNFEYDQSNTGQIVPTSECGTQKTCLEECYTEATSSKAENLLPPEPWKNIENKSGGSSCGCSMY